MPLARTSTAVSRSPTQQGASLVEALVALLIMAAGMLALVGLITGARHSTEVARQRSEALTLARAELATLRSFGVLSRTAATPPGTRAYADITDQPQPLPVTPPDSNTTFHVQRTVMPLPTAGRGRLVRVGVRWTDRAGTPQQVQLDAVIAEVDPIFAAALPVAPAPPP